ncbi:hypothetical protein HOT75_gp096 [Gordonia phage Daredevil]|uniref:Uncharacterized protein n=1 Tax=Gordonia phage Daredevil TaxID=2283286 RepID=A0A345MIV2_9CAUD|nr:hypothetical protein HOT75_gp096 [Gordonia phage Daredevil]AXH70483.1 hypothetical protein SEA_DAREDEVIL_96 [Gordonia phage Daredevil]
MTEWHVGQKVWFSPGHRRRGASQDREVEITKLGRKYAYVNVIEHGKDVGFDMRTGRQKGDPNSSWLGHFITMERHLNQERERAVLGALSSRHDLVYKTARFRHEPTRHSLDTLELVLEVLDRGVASADDL